MITTTHLTHTVATAAAALIATFGTAGVAVARPDLPSEPAASTPSSQSTQHWSVPRTEGPGVQPLDHDADPAITTPVAAAGVDAGAAAAVSLARADDGASDTDWLPFAAIAGALGLLAALAFGLARSDRTLSHPFRTPRA